MIFAQPLGTQQARKNYTSSAFELMTVLFLIDYTLIKTKTAHIFKRYMSCFFCLSFKKNHLLPIKTQLSPKE